MRSSVKEDSNEDESLSSPLLHDPQNSGSDQNLADPEERRRVERNYYQGHAIRNPDEDASEDLDEVTTTDHTILVHVDKRKDYGTLSSQILSNERLNYMWKNIGRCAFVVVVVTNKKYFLLHRCVR